MRTAAQLKKGQKAMIYEVKISGSRGKRLMEMGFFPSAEIKLVRKAPMGDPLLVEILGYRVAIRKKTAERIMVI